MLQRLGGTIPIFGFYATFLNGGGNLRLNVTKGTWIVPSKEWSGSQLTGSNFPQQYLSQFKQFEC